MFLTHIINSFLLEAIFVCHVYTHAHAQMCQTSERSTAARSEKSIAELRASKRRKTSVEDSSQCGAAEQQSITAAPSQHHRNPISGAQSR